MADIGDVPQEASHDGQTLYPSRQGAHQGAHQGHHHKGQGFWHKHSLGIASIVIVTTWLVAYCFSDPSTHIGSFFGNAIADWSGVVVTVFGTKWLYEKNSAESRRPPKDVGNPIFCWLRDHSLTIFLLLTGAIWTVLFIKMDANSKWGQVVGNIVSEWTQAVGMVVLTKRLIETKSKE